MRALILSNGNINDYEYIAGIAADMIICCDGGLRHIDRLKLKPDIIIGDFDSVDKELVNKYGSLGAKIIRLPVDKDLTDTESAINFALEEKASEIFIFGGTGTRFDHTLSNAHCLIQALDKGVMAALIDEHNIITVTNSKIELRKNEYPYISLIPLTTEVSGVTTTGMKYPLTNECLKIGYGRGVSNEFVEDTACVTVSKGLLFVIQTRD